MTKPAIILLAQGLPNNFNQLDKYYQQLQRGRFTHRKLIKRIAKLYDLTGGIEYYSTINYQQGAGVVAQLKANHVRLPVRLAFLYTQPSIPTIVDELVEEGITDLYGLPLRAHYSNYLTERYHRAVLRELNKTPGITYHRVNSLWNQPSLFQYWQDQLLIAKRRSPWIEEQTQFLFIADSLPRHVANSDPYCRSVALNARRLAHIFGLTNANYRIGWVSSPRLFHAHKLVGLSIEKTIDWLVKKRHAQTIVVVPIGFLQDCLVLDYDINLTLRHQVTKLGAELVQLPAPNASAGLIKAICDRLLLAMATEDLKQANCLDQVALNEQTAQFHQIRQNQG